MNAEEPDQLRVLGFQVEQLQKRLAEAAWLLSMNGDAPPEVQARLIEEQTKEHLKREARRWNDAREYQLACGDRQIVSYASLLAQPKPPWIIEGKLTAGVYGLAGPPEAGKSLLCRDWLCEVAAGGRYVLYAISEGQHDLADRFAAHPLIGAAGPYLSFLDAGLSLASPADVAWLTEQYKPWGVALIVFDMIYGFGLPDDTGTGDIAPVLGGCKKLATELGCAVLVTGHPGHSTGRRFRGSSMWRGAFDGEFHMADGSFSCEKHKYTDKTKIHFDYTVEFPWLRQLDVFRQVDRWAHQEAQIQRDLDLYPGESDSARARRLGPQLGLTFDHVRRLIRQAKASRKDGQDG
jgi:AAA domain-containing protein